LENVNRGISKCN